MNVPIKIGVVVFPGSNCDQDMVDALSVYSNVEVTKLWHKDRDLKGSQLVVLPGGFSFGDYLRSGAIARFSPIMEEVIAFANNGGFVLGVCNGFQILCESHLLPGALLHNESHQFICRNVFIKAENETSAFTKGLSRETVLKIPIAHGEGRFYADAQTLKELNDNGQVSFRYCPENGDDYTAYNPNGATEDIAGICNKEKNVFGMMPHPERAADVLLGNLDGRKILDTLLKNLFGEVAVEMKEMELEA